MMLPSTFDGRNQATAQWVNAVAAVLESRKRDALRSRVAHARRMESTIAGFGGPGALRASQSSDPELIQMRRQMLLEQGPWQYQDRPEYEMLTQFGTSTSPEVYKQASIQFMGDLIGRKLAHQMCGASGLSEEELYKVAFGSSEGKVVKNLLNRTMGIFKKAPTAVAAAEKAAVPSVTGAVERAAAGGLKGVVKPPSGLTGGFPAAAHAEGAVSRVAGPSVSAPVSQASTRATSAVGASAAPVGVVGSPPVSGVRDTLVGVRRTRNDLSVPGYAPGSSIRQATPEDDALFQAARDKFRAQRSGVVGKAPIPNAGIAASSTGATPQSVPRPSPNTPTLPEGAPSRAPVDRTLSMSKPDIYRGPSGKRTLNDVVLPGPTTRPSAGSVAPPPAAAAPTPVAASPASAVGTVAPPPTAGVAAPTKAPLFQIPSEGSIGVRQVSGKAAPIGRLQAAPATPAAPTGTVGKPSPAPPLYSLPTKGELQPGVHLAPDVVGGRYGRLATPTASTPVGRLAVDPTEAQLARQTQGAVAPATAAAATPETAAAAKSKPWISTGNKLMLGATGLGLGGAALYGSGAISGGVLNAGLPMLGTQPSDVYGGPNIGLRQNVGAMGYY
jgi:hypothetical protein